MILIKTPEVNIALEIDVGLSIWVLKLLLNSWWNLGVRGDELLLSDLGDKFKGVVGRNWVKGFGECGCGLSSLLLSSILIL